VVGQPPAVALLLPLLRKTAMLHARSSPEASAVLTIRHNQSNSRTGPLAPVCNARPSLQHSRQPLANLAQNLGSPTWWVWFYTC